jgi:hypothetical protein
MRLILGGIVLAGGLAAAFFALSDRVPNGRLADIGNVAPATARIASTASSPEVKPSSGGAFEEAPDDGAAAIPRPSASAARMAQAAVEPAASIERGSGAPLSRNAVLHELQRQLKRVGCYKGRIGEDWASATRPSMMAFLERVNATLPTTEPDEVLLTLVRAAPGLVCGSPCPRGQSMADGRCQPDALLTRNPATEPASSGLTSLPAPAIVATPSAAGPEDATRLAGDPTSGDGADGQVRKAKPRLRASNDVNVRPRNDNWVSRAFGSGL